MNVRMVLAALVVLSSVLAGCTSDGAEADDPTPGPTAPGAEDRVVADTQESDVLTGTIDKTWTWEFEGCGFTFYKVDLRFKPPAGDTNWSITDLKLRVTRGDGSVAKDISLGGTLDSTTSQVQFFLQPQPDSCEDAVAQGESNGSSNWATGVGTNSIEVTGRDARVAYDLVIQLSYPGEAA